MWEGAGVPAGEVPYGSVGLMMGDGVGGLDPARGLVRVEDKRFTEPEAWGVTAPWQHVGRKERGRSGWDSRCSDPFIHTKTVLALSWVPVTRDVGGKKAKSQVT